MANKVYWGYNPTTQRYDVLDSIPEEWEEINYTLGYCVIKHKDFPNSYLGGALTNEEESSAKPFFSGLIAKTFFNNEDLANISTSGKLESYPTELVDGTKGLYRGIFKIKPNKRSFTVTPRLVDSPDILNVFSKEFFPTDGTNINLSFAPSLYNSSITNFVSMNQLLHDEKFEIIPVFIENFYISLNMQGTITKKYSNSIEGNFTISELNDPPTSIPEGYKFVGYYLEGGVMNLEPQWDKYTLVSFNTSNFPSENDPELYKPIRLEYGYNIGNLEWPPVPTGKLENKVHEGYYIDDRLTEKVDLNMVPDTDTLLYSNFIADLSLGEIQVETINEPVQGGTTVQLKLKAYVSSFDKLSEDNLTYFKSHISIDWNVLDNEVDTTPAVDWAIVDGHFEATFNITTTISLEGTCQVTFDTHASNVATFMLSKA